MFTQLRTCLCATLCAIALASTSVFAQQAVTFWYHVDNPENTKLMDELVKSFEAKNPGIRINAENVPWNSYFEKLFIAIAGGKAPDVALVRLALQPQLLEMGALEPITQRLDAWPGKAETFESGFMSARNDPGFVRYAGRIGTQRDEIAPHFEDPLVLLQFLRNDIAEHAAFFGFEIVPSGA